MQTLPEAARSQAERGACHKETPRRTTGADAAQKALNSAQSPSDRAGCAAPPFAFGPAHQFMAMLGIRRNSPGPFPWPPKSRARAASRADRIPLGILFMLGATVMFAISSALSKWQVAEYSF